MLFFTLLINTRKINVFFWCFLKISTQYIVHMLKNVDFIDFFNNSKFYKYFPQNKPRSFKSLKVTKNIKENSKNKPIRKKTSWVFWLNGLPKIFSIK